MIELNENNFKTEVLNAEEPVFVEFWATWSNRSRAVKDLLQNLADDRAGDVKVVTVDMEKHELLAEEYGIRAVPTILVFKQGQLRDQIVGRTSQRELNSTLERID